MGTLRAWVSALRLRTLPLAASAVILGTTLAFLHLSYSPGISALCLLTALLLQVLSNLANDYGDFSKGTDNMQRIGNMRALQSGSIRPQQMLRAIVLFALLSFLSGLILLFAAAEGHINVPFVIFLLLGLLSIAAAITYTSGKRAYGYSGMGDAAVFLFFGVIAVGGTFSLNMHFRLSFANLPVILPSAGIGLLCAAVLNTNNIRDIDNDRDSGKFTIPVRIGIRRARIYHAFLILGGLACLFIYTCRWPFRWPMLLQVPASFFIVRNLWQVSRTLPSAAYNGYLKGLSLGILFFILIYCATMALAAVN